MREGDRELVARIAGNLAGQLLREVPGACNEPLAKAAVGLAIEIVLEAEQQLEKLDKSYLVSKS